MNLGLSPRGVLALRVYRSATLPLRPLGEGSPQGAFSKEFLKMDEKTEREKERKALFEKWDGPAQNPRYRGQTPKEIARALMRRPLPPDEKNGG